MDIYIDITQPLSPLYASEERRSTIRSLILKRGNESTINVNIIGSSLISWDRTKLTIKRAGRYDDPPVIDGYCDGTGGSISILAESQALRDDLGVGLGRDIPQVHYIGEILLETVGSTPQRLACKTFDVVVQNNVERGEDAPVDPPRPNYPPADQVATKADAVPAGGKAGQVLAKTDDADRHTGWVDPPSNDDPKVAVAEHNKSNIAHPDIRNQMTSLVKSSVPIGGTTGQVLTKASDASNDVGWVDPPTGGGGGDVDGAITVHNTSTSSHADLRNSLVPQSGMVGQVLIKWGVNAGQHRWETAPWATVAQNDALYMSNRREANSQGVRLKQGSHIVFEPSFNNTNYRIVNKDGVLGYQPFNSDQSGTDYVGFVPFGGGFGGMSFAQYNYNDLEANALRLRKGAYKINLTYFNKSDSTIGCIPDADYQSQLQYLRPFDTGTYYKAYNATISVIDAPSPSGQFYRQGGPLTFSVKDLIDPNDVDASKLIINPGDYIDHVCAQNKDPFTGYSYINIELLLDVTYDNPKLFDNSWLYHVGTYYTPFVNLVIIKL